VSDSTQVNSSKVNSKVYVEIVKQLKHLIEKNGLKPGDRLPSERELSERLNAGRSSVREALRALELLGLIETKRGEGTYIRDFKEHQLIPLLGGFILQGEKSKHDVIETKALIEKDCLILLLNKQVSEKRLENVLHEIDEDYTFEDFMMKIITLTDNTLILKIWLVLKDYYFSIGFTPLKPKKEDYDSLIQALNLKDHQKVLNMYEKIKGNVE
jgi:GntR family transcriptional regulator, transcriptional repressor for pyruvate dehydrogenase complex